MTDKHKEYKEAIIGYTMGLEPNGNAGIPIYDFDKLAQCLVDDGTCESLEETDDYICYNQSYNQGTSIIATTEEPEGE